jgi:TatD DNase family protein
MKYIDTHSHLYSSHFDADQGEVIARAQAVLEAVFLPNISVETVDRMHALCDAAPDFFFPMLGLHPSDVGEDWEAQLARLQATMAAGERRYYGIGETGMDLYWPDNRETRPWQEASLRAHIRWAKETGLPIILHTRKCTDEVIDLIQEQHDESLWGIFHCWEGSKKQARRVV